MSSKNVSQPRLRWYLFPRGSKPAVFFFQAEDGIRDVAVTGVQTCALPICVADLDAIGGSDDVVITGAADNLAALQLAHRPRQHIALLLTFQRGRNVGGRLPGLGHGSEPQFPQSSVGRCACQLLFVEMGKRLELDPVTLQGDRRRPDQAAPRSSPSLRNMSRIPRSAWRRRCSFSISAMRT